MTEILSKKEKKQLLYDFNNTSKDYPLKKLYMEFFEEQVKKTPHNKAVVYRDRELTYKELHQRSNQIAGLLRHYGVKPDMPVSIMVEPSLEMITGVMAIIKAGGAYVPVDPSYPSDRINYILKDSNSSVILSQRHLSDRITFNGTFIDLEDENFYKEDKSVIPVINSPSDLAYIIYTSGSTGKPKGVMVEHSSMLNICLWYKEEMALTEKDSGTKFVAFGFDPTIIEIFPLLISGGTLHIIDEETRLSPYELNRYFEKNNITVTILPTQFAEEFMDISDNKTLRALMVGGEKLRFYHRKNYRLINAYGPTEYTVCTTSFSVDKDYDNIPIGKPVANTSIYIVDEENNLQPPGKEGELCIAGKGIARGYLNRDDLTAEKFVKNPFVPGEKMYRTGDLAQWLPDGNIEFLGRIDQQVKIRGFRIEPGEIEQVMMKHEDIKDAVVADKHDCHGNKYLCCYIISDKDIDKGELKTFLSKELPDYMIPTYIMNIDKIPLTPNGKVDKKALPEPAGLVDSSADYLPAENKIQIKLVEIWKDVLGIEPIGINDNFFSLGGHSLKAAMVQAKIEKAFKTLIALKDIFRLPTIRELSMVISEKTVSDYPLLERVKDREYYPLSSVQKRLFILEQSCETGTVYNIPMYVTIEGNLDILKLKNSLHTIVDRHEVLRTTFHIIDGQAVQKIHKDVKVDIPYRDLFTDKNNSSHEFIGTGDGHDHTHHASRITHHDFIKPFDLKTGPLFRFELIRISPQNHVLLMDIHHIVFDGVSMAVFLKEFSALYTGSHLETLNIQYRDFSVWQEKLFKKDFIKHQEQFWTESFSDEIPVLELPLDYTRPVIQDFKGNNITFTLNKELTAHINRLAKDTDSTVHMILLASLHILLSKYSSSEDIVTGAALAGRGKEDLQPLIGMFVNMLPVRTRPEGNKIFKDFLGEVRENLLKIYDNQDFQLEHIIDKLKIKRETGRNPLFDVAFVLENMDLQDIHAADLKIKSELCHRGTAKFDLTFMGEEKKGEIEFDLEYRTSLFKEETIKRMARHFINILRKVTEHPENKIKDINILSSSERRHVLYDFNDTGAHYGDLIFIQTFEEQAAKTPHNIAVVYKDTKLTYEELNEKSNQLARLLRKEGVKPDTLVAILVDRSPEMIIGVLAILKAGGAYVPVDPEYPQERKIYILEDTGSHLLLSQKHLSSSVQFNGKILDLDDKNIYHGDSSNLPFINRPSDMAYVIYTSGSTGKPKGVMIEHKSLANFCNWYIESHNLTEKDRIPKFVSFTFDASIIEIFPTLSVGASLYMVPDELRYSVYELNNYFDANNITGCFLTTAFGEQYIESVENSSLRYMDIGGDKLKLYKKRNYTIYHVYGPTENTVYSTMFLLDRFYDNFPIGKPLSNTKVYIIDKFNNLLPVGVPGELCTAGRGLARGYLNRPSLTSEKFADDPFVPGEKMYRTGDLARWLSDGNIEFLGRIDSQVKIRGFRVEPGEIEQIILKQEAVKDTVVIARKDEMGNKYLCCYIVSDKEIKPGELKKAISKELPDYMIPSYIMNIEKIPLTPNGKIDRKALPEPSGDQQISADYVAPENEIEAKLAHIWQEVLNIPRAGIDDNFFSLGGHSLKSASVQAKIEKSFNIIIPLKDMFRLPTIRQIAEIIPGMIKSLYPPLEKADMREYYPLSSVQKRLFVMEQLGNTGTAYNIPMFFTIEGNLSPEKVGNILQILIDRHEALRTTFDTVDGMTVQKINKHVPAELKYSKITPSGIEETLKKFVRPFDLKTGPLFRFELVKYGLEQYLFLLDIHHIVFDGYSLAIFLRELSELYRGDSLAELKFQYKDFTLWQEKLIMSDFMRKQEEFWLKSFASDIPVLELPSDYARPAVQDFEGDRIRFLIEKDLTLRLNRLAGDTGSTLYMVLLSALNILLSKYSSSEDIITGTAVAGRGKEELQSVAGMFVNSLPVRTYPSSDKSFRDFLFEVKENLLKIYDNQDIQLEYLIDMLKIRRETGRNPLFDVFFVLENMDIPELFLEGCSINQKFCDNKIAKFDLTFMGEEKRGEIEFNLEYRKSLFKEETIKRMSDHFINLLRKITDNPDEYIKDIDIITSGERKTILYDFNQTETDYPKDRTVIEFFQEQVEKNPEHRAVVYKDKSLTYRELNEKANQVAGILIKEGVKPDTLVAILADRSPEMIVGVMAIIKSGGAYVPVDPEYPVERIAYILEDTETKILLSQKHLYHKIKFSGHIFDLEDISLYYGDKSNPSVTAKPSSLAYIIYTSGSTGKPKGVMIEHRPLLNMCLWYKDTRHLNEKDNMTKFASFGFDASIWEIFPCLMSGAALHIISEDIRMSPSELNSYFEENNITVSFLPTQFAEQFIEMFENSQLRWVDTGGDKLRFFRKKNYLVVNNYGPTEYTVCTTSFIIDKYYDNIPIGKPLSNTRVYILDKFNRIQPVGVPGELCISGSGIARGYLNRPELTAEKFVENPFVPGEKMYRTGDMARWLSDGNIEFLGRIDAQVKIRGFRIEPGEIEQVLLRQPDIKDAVVVDKKDNTGNKYLCCYVVSEKEINVGGLKKQLSGELPDYMIPAYIMKIEKIPLTPNGKVDRKSLPEPEGFSESEYVAARNETDRKLLAIWQEILAIEKIGIDDNFFSLGGHSLKAALVQAKIEKQLGSVISLKDIFKLPTVRQLSEIISGEVKSNYPAIETIEDMPYYPLSSVQKRLFILEQLGSIDATYNIPMIFSIEGHVDMTRLSNAFDSLVNRHESLRTSFELIDGVPVQKINREVYFKKIYVESSEEVLPSIIQDFVKPFNLNKPPLFRVQLIKISEEKYMLLIDIHHIIFDGFSVAIFIKELSSLYRGKELDTLNIQYKDFVLWQEKLLKSDFIKKQEEFWLNKFAGELPVLSLQTDYQRPVVQSFKGERVKFLIDRELAYRLNRLAGDTGSTLHIVLTAALNVLLSKYTSQEDIIIGTVLAGRPIEELQSIIGMFVNTVPVRNYIKSETTFKEFLLSVKNEMIKIYDNQDYQIDALIDKLNIKRESGRNPLFDVLLVLENMDIPEILMGDLKISSDSYAGKIAKFDITFACAERRGEIEFDLEYRTDLFKEETIRKMIDHFINILRKVTDNPDSQIKDIDFLTSSERRALLYEFNNTDIDYPKDRTWVEYFLEQSEKTPEHKAVVYKNRSLTYRELNEKTNSLARLLRSSAIKEESHTGIMVDFSLEMIIGVIAIIKAGGAYVPLDPSYPPDRINYILKDSNAQVILSQKHLFDRLDFDGTFIDLEDERSYRESSENLPVINSPSSLAYIIYTSGSTGKPKGVMIEHHSMLNLCLWYRDTLNITPEDNTGKYLAFGFDPTVMEIFPPLICGAAIHVIPEEIRLSPVELNKYFEDNHITFCILPTQFGEEFIGSVDNSSLKYLLVGGDKLKNYHNKNYELLNAYGPTEYTVATTVFHVDKHYDNIPIGKPLANTKLFIVDKFNNLQPVGVPGELCISGRGIARGYLNRPDLTKEKFVENPFIHGEKMYRTGDLARWLPDGNIEFLGRIDQQVKIRGFRIELGEIEQVIKRQKDIKDAAVVDKKDSGGDKYLCGYIVSHREINIDELKLSLARELPEYMIPSHILQIEKLPLTPNGKLNRKALPEPEIDTSATYIPPANDIERNIAGIWEEVLNIKSVGMEDNFFSLGGHSLKAVTLVAKLQDNFEVTVNDIFKYQTVRKLAEHITEKKGYLKTKLYRLKDMVSIPVDYTDDMKTSIETYHRDIDKYIHMDLSGRKHYKNVMLTGSTGYLGIHLLRTLLEHTDCSIYLIIRGVSREEAKERLNKKICYYFAEEFYDKYSERIHVFNGNLSDGMFGLSPDLYSEMSHKIDCIIHSAANVRHYGHYEEFHKSNVVATEKLLAFAGTGKLKDFNHISTVSVAAGLVPGHDRMVFTDNDCDMGQKAHNYYVETKLMSEKIVLSARQKGLITNIFRVGNLVFNSKTGIFQENIDENGFYNILKSYLNMGIICDDDMVDLSFVDSVSEAIISLYDRQNLENEIFHISNPNVVRLSDLLTSDTSFLYMDTLKHGEFIDYLYKNLDRRIYKSSIENIMLHKGWLSEGGEGTDFIVLSDKTSLILKNTGFTWPVIHMEPMKKMIKEALLDRILFFREVPLFSTLSEEELLYFAGLAREEYYSDESTLLWEGNINDNLYILMEGNLELMKNSRAGWLGTIGVLGPKDFLGEGNLIKTLPSPVSAEVCMGDARILTFRKGDILKLMKNYPQFGINFVQELSERVRKLETLIVNIG